MFMSLYDLVGIIEFSRDCARPVHFHLILESSPLGINHASVYFYSISDLVFNNDMWWTPLTSHYRAEIDHIRLVIFQIRVENLKTGPPGFHFFVCFDVIRSEDQSQCRILSQRGPPGCAEIVWICDLDTKSYRSENRMDPSFGF